MSDITVYIMSIVSVCLISSIIVHLTKGMKLTGEVSRMLCGIFIAITVFSPIIQLRWNKVTDYLDKMINDAQATASDGSQLLQQQKNDSIQQRLEAYILDKASAYGCELTAQVELTNQDPPIPQRVTIQGSVSPYQKAQLSEMIAAELGIPKEMQTWNAFNS